MAKQYFGEHSLRSLIRLIKTALGTKVNNSDIVNNLTTTDNQKVLSAVQGKLLNEKIQAIDSDGDGIADNSNLLEGHPASYFVKAEDFDGKIGDQKGKPDGIAPLDSNGLVDSQYLPSYVDDVIEGYAEITTTGEGESAVTTVKFYEEAAKTTEITGETGKIYIDLATNNSYRWSGSTYVLITSSDLVELEETDIEALWDAVTLD